MKRDDMVSLAVALAGPMLGGQIVGMSCANDVKGRWYTKLLKKPRWTPPGWVFGVVWPVLYVGQSVASWLVFKNKDAKRVLPLSLYGVQLVLNLIWQPLFFKAHRVDAALVDSTAVLGLAAAAGVTMTRAAGDKGAKIAVGSLMGPYVAWLAFATALNAKILKDNPKAHELDRDETSSKPAAPGTASARAAKQPEDVIKSAGANVIKQEKTT